MVVTLVADGCWALYVGRKVLDGGRWELAGDLCPVDGVRLMMGGGRGRLDVGFLMSLDARCGNMHARGWMLEP